MENSPFLKLNSWDFYKGIAVFAISAVLTSFLAIFQNKGFDITGEEGLEIAKVAVVSVVSYLIKNVFTNTTQEFGKKDK